MSMKYDVRERWEGEGDQYRSMDNNNLCIEYMDNLSNEEFMGKKLETIL